MRNARVKKLPNGNVWEINRRGGGLVINSQLISKLEAD